MDEIKSLAHRYRSVYEKFHNELEIPFFSGFPKNCCEGASFFFGYCISTLFPRNDVEIIKGVRQYNGHTEYHFWIEVDGLIYDLTADQFNCTSLPVIGEVNHPLHNQFKECQRESVKSYFLYYIGIKGVGAH